MKYNILRHIICMQACEQLNAWLGGFESILKRMTPDNFNWFLHTMLFYHTQRVIQKQEEQDDGEEDDDEEVNDGDRGGHGSDSDDSDA